MVGPPAEPADVAEGLAVDAHLQLGADPVNENVGGRGGTAPPAPLAPLPVLAGEHVLAAALDDGRVGRDMAVGREDLHAVAS